MMGDIVERTFTPEQLKFAPDERMSSDYFPRVEKLDLSDVPTTKTGSLFAQMVAKKQKTEAREAPMHEESAQLPATGEDIHVENVARLAQMSNAEILAEQQRLMQSLDPSLIEFLKARKSVPANKAETLERVTKTLEAERESEKTVDLEVLQEKGAENWLHFDVVEAEKLEWTKDIEEKKKSLKPGEQFEARFDWKGILLPFEDTTGISEDNRDLFLHGEEPSRPGYTLQELFRLARSNVLQQRITAITSIAGILNIYNQGFYDGILALPLAKLFFFLRFALDENTPALVEVTARALAFLFYNDTDETLCDVLFETAAGVNQPALEQQKLNASFVLDEAFGGMNLEEEEHVARSTAKPAYVSTLDDEELADKQAMTDFHMAETDLVEALLRTNILERVRYILFTMRAEEAVVVHLVKLLIRLARTNRDAALKIVALDGLIEPMVAEFLRPIESDDKCQPLYLVLKLFRVIGAYDMGMMVRLQNAGVLEAVEKYVFSRRDISVSRVF
jgi:RNA polymerase II-associated protein 1